MKDLNSSATNWSPLSLTNCSGKPWVVKSFLNSSTVFGAVVEFIFTTSGHFECASATTRNISAMNSPTNATCIRCQGELAIPTSAMVRFPGFSGSVDSPCIPLSSVQLLYPSPATTRSLWPRLSFWQQQGDHYGVHSILVSGTLMGLSRLFPTPGSCLGQ